MSKINTIKVDKGKVILELSTTKIARNTVKSSYAQSYPLFPHFCMWRTLIYITKKETHVLWISDKSLSDPEKCGKPIDFYIIKYWSELFAIFKQFNRDLCKQMSYKENLRRFFVPSGDALYLQYSLFPFKITCLVSRSLMFNKTRLAIFPGVILPYWS